MGLAYDVAIRFRVDDLRIPADALTGGSAGRAALANVNSSFKGMRSAAMDVGSRLSDAFTGAVERAGQLVSTMGKAGLVAGVALATYGVMGLNNQLEQTQISLAAVFQARGFTNNFADATRLASDQIAKMKVDADKLPGTFGELAMIMSTIATPAAMAGMSPDAIRKMAGSTENVGRAVLGTAYTPELASRELSELLGGQARRSNRLGRSLGFTDERASKLRSESGEDRVKDINAEFAKWAPAAEAFGNSFAAVWTTLRNKVEFSFIQPVTASLFSGVKNVAGAVSHWFDSNKTLISAWTTSLGSRIEAAFEWGTHKIGEWGPAVLRFAMDAYSRIESIWTRIEPVVSRVAAGIRESLMNGAALDKIESILKMYALLKVGGVLSPIAGAGISGLMGGGGGAAGVGAGLGGAVAGGLLLGGAIAAGGELHALADASSAYHKDAVRNATELGSAWNQIMTDFSSGHTILSGFFDWFGTEGTRELAVFTRGLGDILANRDVNGNKQAWRDLGNYFTPGNPDDDVALAKYRASLDSDVFSPNRDKSLDFNNTGFGNTDPLLDPDRSSKIAAASGKGKGHSTTINNTIYMTVSSNQEPSRIARHVVQKMAEATRFPKSSPYTRDFLSGRT